MRKIIFFTFILLIPISLFGKKRYYIKNVEIVGELNSNGSMDVTEKRTYSFKGRFKYAYQKFKKNNNIIYDNFSVSEGPNNYYFSKDKDIDTYQILEEDDNIEIRWYFKAIFS